jgi:hypothetical protein
MQAEKRRSYKFIFWAIVILGGNLFSSCQDEDCVSIFNNYLLVGFEDENGDPVDTMFYSVTAIGNDAVFYDKDTTLSILTLPVDPASNFTTFELEMIDSIRYDSLSNQLKYYVNPTPHIITVSYRRTERIITEDCGVGIAYTNLFLEEITFPSFDLKNDNLSRLHYQFNNEVNIEVFF